MRAIGLVLIIFWSSVSIGDESTSPQTIRAIHTGWSGEGFYIATNEKPVLEGCSLPVFRMDIAHPMMKDVLSIALSAYHSKSRVIMRVSGCTGGYMNLIAINVLD
ncbi:MAG: hypothetical protein ABW086_11415 [Sedimenticola sp.]